MTKKNTIQHNGVTIYCLPPSIAMSPYEYHKRRCEAARISKIRREIAGLDA